GCVYARPSTTEWVKHTAVRGRITTHDIEGKWNREHRIVGADPRPAVHRRGKWARRMTRLAWPIFSWVHRGRWHLVGQRVTARIKSRARLSRTRVPIRSGMAAAALAATSADTAFSYRLETRWSRRYRASVRR